MARSTGNGYLIETDVDAYPGGTGTTPDFQNLCPTSVTPNQNEEIDTWYDLCSEYANNEKTAMDPSWDITFKSDSTNTAKAAVISDRYLVGTNYPFRVTDIDTGEVIEFNGVITAFTETVETPTVIEYSFTLKVYDAAITIT